MNLISGTEAEEVIVVSKGDVLGGTRTSSRKEHGRIDLKEASSSVSSKSLVFVDVLAEEMLLRVTLSISPYR